MIDRKEVELLIRAQLKGGRDITAITKSIADLEKAITSQAEAAKRGESSYEGLKAAAAGLKGVIEELGGRAQSIQQFEKLTKQIDKQTGAVEKAKNALAEYEKKVGTDRTDAQQQKVQRLTDTFQRAERELASYQQTFTVFSKVLRDAGVDIANLGIAQRQVAEQQLQAVSAQNRINQELVEYSTNISAAREATRKQAEADREAAKAADLFAAAEKRASDAARARNERFQAFDQTQAARKGQVVGSARSDQEQAAAAARAQELAALRADIEQRSAKAFQDTGLNKAAADAEAAVRQYTTLARAATDLKPKIVSLREAVDGIINPGAAARATLASVESEIAALNTKLASGKGAITDYAAEFKNLQAAQKAVSGQAGLLDNFRNQIAALRETRTELSAARAQVAQYAAAVRQGGEAGAAFVKPLAEAQARVKAAALAFREQVTATREARDALRAAGIDARNLADAEARLVTATRGSTDALKQLTIAARANAEAQASAGKGFKFFNDEGRTTLSFAQRLRGELLALTTAYFGVQGAVQLASDSLKSFSQAQGLRSGLSFALGDDPTKIGDELDYIRQQADRLGIAFEGVSKDYVKFAAAAVKSGAPIKETRFIFESFAEVGRTLNLTPDAINGLFNAIGQSFSKGKIQAEELRQQIGERLPGAFAFAQQALKDKFPDLNKALEKGEVGAENLLIIAESVRKAAQSGLTPALKGLDAEQQRFNNSVFFFKQQIADAGFADAYVALLQQLTEFFKSDEGTRFATTLAEIGKMFISVLSAGVEFRKELGLLIALLATAFTAGLLTKAAAGILSLGTAAAASTAGIASLAGAITAVGTALKAAVPIIAAALVGFSIGTYLYEQSAEVRVAGALLVTTIAQLWSRIKFGAMELWEALPILGENALKALVNAANRGVNNLLRIISAGARALGMNEFADSVAKAIVVVDLKYEGASDRLKQIREEAAADLAAIKKIGDEMVNDAIRGDRVTLASKNKGVTAKPETRKGGPKELTEAEINKREKMIDALDSALNALDAKIERAQTESLSKQLEAVDDESKRLFKKIAEVAKFDPTKALEFSRRAQQLIEEQKLVITRKFNDKLLTEQESVLTKVEEAEAAAGRKQKLSLDERLAAMRKSYENEYRKIADLRQKLVDNGRSTAPADEAKRRLDAAVADLDIAERQKFMKEELARREQQINDLLTARAERLKTVADLESTGNLTQAQADERRRTIIAELQPQIEALVVLGQEFAASINGAFDPAAIEQFIAKLQLAAGSGARLNQEFDRTGNIIRNGIGAGVDKTLNGLYDSLVKVINKTGDWGDVFDGVAKTILQSIADILLEIGKAILKQQILLALKSVGLPVPVAHSGMVVGQGSDRSRNASGAWFANAPRYHAGGIVGLRPDEYPAILQKNEEVLSKSDPRNVLNGGGGGAKAAAPQSQRFVLVDDRARMAEAMAGQEGEQVTLVHLRNNLPTIRAWVKGG